jgi:hypothetical protein
VTTLNRFPLTLEIYMYKKLVLLAAALLLVGPAFAANDKGSTGKAAKATTHTSKQLTNASKKSTGSAIGSAKNTAIRDTIGRRSLNPQPLPP